MWSVLDSVTTTCPDSPGRGFRGSESCYIHPRCFLLLCPPFVFATITVWTLAGAIHTLWDYLWHAARVRAQLLYVDNVLRGGGGGGGVKSFN